MQKVVATTTWTWLRSRNKIPKKNTSKSRQRCFCRAVSEGASVKDESPKAKHKLCRTTRVFCLPSRWHLFWAEEWTALATPGRGWGLMNGLLQGQQRRLMSLSAALIRLLCASTLLAQNPQWFDWFGSKFVCWLLVNYKQPFISFLWVEP